MKRQKFPYWEWEDYTAGLYRIAWGEGRSAADALLILADPPKLQFGMELAVKAWPKATAHHLTDGGLNGRAWLGWAACGILAEIPAHVTRAAWWQLAESKRARANDAAAAVIDAYRGPKVARIRLAKETA